ncbi:transcriptional regulator, TraR/DksA family protein [Oceanisphaera avium]|uniref:Transcriptional regulator, TraR/DksA family protein n=1 Tax=Oceanisphaera avium TaxID=1903694 RepID=A0A1Y0CUY4_9GAMM|nr:transcriptional regulator, TraR/DksA family protein [Oceanisphaera avium]ART79153.1 transcriptional regulator, TraR/DksA family protein [Oceanisphaera avium]
MSSILESQLEERLGAEVSQQRQAFLQAVQALDSELARQLTLLSPDEWADQGALYAWPQLQPYIKQLKKVDAALCQQQLGLYGLCSDCEVELSRELLFQDPCRQRCSLCHSKFLNSQPASWKL